MPTPAGGSVRPTAEWAGHYAGRRKGDALKRQNCWGWRWAASTAGSTSMVPYMMSADIVSRAVRASEYLDAAGVRRSHHNSLQNRKKLPLWCRRDHVDGPHQGAEFGPQAVILKATYSRRRMKWYLDRVKRFLAVERRIHSTGPLGRHEDAISIFITTREM